MISNDTIQKLANLSRLRFDDAQSAEMATKLESIIGFVDQLSAVNTEGVAPVSGAVTAEADAPTPMREDVPITDINRNANMANAPKAEDGFFVVPQVIE